MGCLLGRATQLGAEARRLDKQAAPAGGYEHGHMHDTAAIFPSYSCAEKAKAQGGFVACLVALVSRACVRCCPERLSHRMFVVLGPTLPRTRTVRE